MRKLPHTAGEDLLEIIMRPYERQADPLCVSPASEKSKKQIKQGSARANYGATASSR